MLPHLQSCRSASCRRTAGFCATAPFQGGRGMFGIRPRPTIIDDWVLTLARGLLPRQSRQNPLKFPIAAPGRFVVRLNEIAGRMTGGQKVKRNWRGHNDVNAETVVPGIRRARFSQRMFECVLSIG